MSSSVKPAFDNLEKALVRLEGVIEKKMSKVQKSHEEPELGLARNEKEVNRKIAAKLDHTISRLETILAEE